MQESGTQIAVPWAACCPEETKIPVPPLESVTPPNTPIFRTANAKTKPTSVPIAAKTSNFLGDCKKAGAIKLWAGVSARLVTGMCL